jgi:uncharacterized membrane protein YfcA
MPDLLDYVTLCLAAVVAGAVNSVAGGGTLLTFPLLFAVLGGSAPAAVMANATSTVALFPGSLAAMAGYRRELRESGGLALLLLGPSLLGGLLGALLLTQLPASSFEALVPWLILTAAMLFWLQPRIGQWTGVGQRVDWGRHGRVTAILFQLLVAIYGGYFGAGIGILMLSALAMMGMSDIHQMNALKTLFASCINGVAVVVFIAEGKVHWPLALTMAASAIAGGYGGAFLARRLDRNLVRRGVVVIGFCLACYYFYRQLSRG